MTGKRSGVGGRDMRGTKTENNKKRIEIKKTVHVNITLPLSQIMREIQAPHWYYCRYKGLAEEIKTIRRPVQSQLKTHTENNKLMLIKI